MLAATVATAAVVALSPCPHICLPWPILLAFLPGQHCDHSSAQLPSSVTPVTLLLRMSHLLVECYKFSAGIEGLASVSAGCKDLQLIADFHC